LAHPDNIPEWAYIGQEPYEPYEMNYDDEQYRSESFIYGYNVRRQADEKEETQRHYNYKDIRRQKNKKAESGDEYASSLNFDDDEY
jgi:hypothetical protein